jgi:hypothetical protein
MLTGKLTYLAFTHHLLRIFYDNTRVLLKSVQVLTFVPMVLVQFVRRKILT